MLKSIDIQSILHIEDNLDDQLIMEEHLSDILTCNIYNRCTRISEAEELLKNTSFDLILLDLTLPDAKGIEAVEKIMELTEKSVPVIVLTGVNDDAIAIDTLKYGVQDYLLKGQFNCSMLENSISYSIERHKVKLELLNKKQELELIRNSLSKAEEIASIGSWEMDLDKGMVHLSRGMKYLIELDIEDYSIQMNDFDNFLSRTNCKELINNLANSAQNHFASEFEVEFVKFSGEKISTICRTETFLNKLGKPEKIYGITSDVTKIKEVEKVKENYTKQLAKTVKQRTAELEKTKVKLEESLEKERELNELKSRFVSTASHQFRTPLTVIQANIGLLELKMEKSKDEESKQLTSKISSRIKNEITRMSGIMDEVLVLGKIAAKGIEPSFEKVCLVDICKEIISSYNQIGDDDREVSLTIMGEERKLNLDKKLIAESLSNLLSNAIKYSNGKKNPEMSIDFSSEVIVKIRDYGIGIPEKEIKSLFTPFFRASNALDYPGNGLGTSILKEYIEINGGTIAVESKINEGTEFTVTL